jgi:hypothetical protein
LFHLGSPKILPVHSVLLLSASLSPLDLTLPQAADEKIMSYDPETNSWAILLSTGIRGFRNACAISGDKMFIFGGDIFETTWHSQQGRQSEISNRTFEYSFTENTWREIPTTGHVLALEAPSGVILNKKYFVVFGGFAPSGLCNRSFALNLETWEWSEIPLLMCNEALTDTDKHKEASTVIYNCPDPRFVSLPASSPSFPSPPPPLPYFPSLPLPSPPLPSPTSPPFPFLPLPYSPLLIVSDASLLLVM